MPFTAFLFLIFGVYYFMVSNSSTASDNRRIVTAVHAATFLILSYLSMIIFFLRSA